MNRRVILIGAGVVLVVAIVLAIKINSSDSSPRTAAPDRASETTGSQKDPANDSGDRTRPTLDPKPTDGTPTASDYVETEIDGVKVRDHRKNPGAPFQLPPTVRQHGPERLPASLVGSISNSLQTAMKDCTASIAADSKGTRPTLEAELVVDIKDKKLTIASSTAQLKDVSGETAAIKQCFEQKSAGKVLPAMTQADGSHYEITLTYHLQK